MSSGIENSANLFDQFFIGYHQNTDSKFFADSEATLRLATASHFKLGEYRNPDEIKIRVFTADANLDGWSGKDSIIQIVMEDMPFIVDSVTAAVERNTRGVLQVLHPILNVERNSDGEVIAFDTENAKAESWVEIVCRRLLLPTAAEVLQSELVDLLHKVVKVNQVWRPIQERFREVECDPKISEFRDWLLDNNFTFMAFAKYATDSGELIAAESVGLETLGFVPEPKVDLHQLKIQKSKVRSEIHRDVQIDEVFLPTTTGGVMVYGLFGLNAYATLIGNIPVVADKISDLVERLAIRPQSHLYKDLLQFANSFPRDVFFAADIDWLERVARSMLNRANRIETQVFAYPSASGNFADVVIYLPRDIVHTKLRLRLETKLQELFSGTEVKSNVRLEDNPLAVLHFAIKLSANSGAISESDLDHALRPLIVDWDRDFADFVIARLGDDVAAHNLLQSYGASFEPNYQNDHAVDLGFSDIRMIMQGVNGQLEIRQIAGENTYSVRIFHVDAPMPLTVLLPQLQAFGLPISAEFPYIFAAPEIRTWWLQELEFQLDRPLAVTTIQELSHAIKAVISGEIEADRLLRLIAFEDLKLADVLVLIAIRNYVSNWSGFAISAIDTALLNNPKLAAGLANLFKSRLDMNDIAVAESLRVQIQTGISEIPSLEQDRILSAILESVLAAVRTNIFVIADFNQSAVAIKFQAQKIQSMPAPRPFAEVWVESARVRGVHIRFGAVARGGLRWSDRLDDLRTEIMGLVRPKS